MSGYNLCRLCRSTCNDSIRLRDASGGSNEIYSITIKFFHPTFLAVEKGAANSLAVLCMECWHHISSFNNYQQTVLLLQANLVKAAEPMKDIGRQSQANSWADLEDVDNISSTGNTIQVDKASQNPSSSVTDCAVRLESTNVGNLTDYPSIENGAQIAWWDNKSTSRDDEYQANEEPGDVFIVDELKEEDEAWDNESHGSSDNLYSNQLLERQSVASSSKRSFTTTERIKKTNIQRTATGDIDAVIAQWKPTLECHICSKSFNTFLSIKLHFQEDHPLDEFYILCCDRKFKYRFRAAEHATLHVNPKAFKCPVCDKHLKARVCLTKHMARAHGPGKTKYKHVCDICGKRFKVHSALRDHYNSHKIVLTTPCKYCDSIFKNRRSLREHMADVHRDRTSFAKTNDFNRSCKLCSQTFTYRTSYYHHLKRQHPAEFTKRKTRMSNSH